MEFAARHRHATVGLPWVSKGEFLRGAWLAGQAGEQVDHFLDSFPVLWPNEKTLAAYAPIYVSLRRTNRMIGPNDLWISACAMAAAIPVLTRNVSEFGRVEGLKVIAYAS